MSIRELKGQAQQLRAKARSFKTKKAQQKAYKAARELEDQVWIRLCDERDKYGKFSFRATVIHFRPKEDRYLVDTPYGSMWLSPTSDVLSKSWYAHTCCIEYTVGQTITVEAIVDVNSDRLTLEVVPGKVTGGTINETQYSELCQHDNLAFFKYPTGMS
ncbi:MAG: hypothetical protein NVS1B10_06360 [Candidatus Saccharimonadales bacterium]